jgi:hypothetical protein
MHAFAVDEAQDGRADTGQVFLIGRQFGVVARAGACWEMRAVVCVSSWAAAVMVALARFEAPRMPMSLSASMMRVEVMHETACATMKVADVTRVAAAAAKAAAFRAAHGPSAGAASMAGGGVRLRACDALAERRGDRTEDAQAQRRRRGR